jgi:hypothetical protein
MKTALAAVAVVTIVTKMAIDAQWADAAVAGACTGDAFVAFASTK